MTTADRRRHRSQDWSLAILLEFRGRKPVSILASLRLYLACFLRLRLVCSGPVILKSRSRSASVRNGCAPSRKFNCPFAGMIHPVVVIHADDDGTSRDAEMPVGDPLHGHTRAVHTRECKTEVRVHVGITRRRGGVHESYRKRKHIAEDKTRERIVKA